MSESVFCHIPLLYKQNNMLHTIVLQIDIRRYIIARTIFLDGIISNSRKDINASALEYSINI